MDTAYPTGSYVFDAGIVSTTITYSADHYPASLPYLTGNDFSLLQGMDPSQNFVFHFNPYITGGLADQSSLFFSIYDYTSNMFVYEAAFLPASTTSLFLPANTLTNNHNYQYELIFSNRDLVSSPGASFDASEGFDLRTTGAFISSLNVPEPSALLYFVSTFLAATFALIDAPHATA